MLPLEIAVYTLVALASTAVATPTPTRGLKQATRADVSHLPPDDVIFAD
jgi:hypothetical protein